MDYDDGGDYENDMPPLRIIFMGTPELACASLQALVAAPALQVIAVVTQPDRPKGRDLKLTPSPVKDLALRQQLPVLQPERARNPDFLQELSALQPDLIAVAAYGQILPKTILDLPRFGCLNVHTSLLPKYRGAAPIQWAIINGDPETGVTIMKMDVGLDTGDVLTQEKTPIQPDDNAETLHDRLAQLGAKLLVQTIPTYVGGTTIPRPQPAEGVSYAPKIKKQDGQINWTQPAHEISNRIRGLVPWPGAFTYLPDQPPRAMLKLWQAEVIEQSGKPGEVLHADKSALIVACGRNALRIQLLQREGGRRLSPPEFLAGHPLKPGQCLG
jgi:methionyl-tRNA formyltransferase